MGYVRKVQGLMNVNMSLSAAKEQRIRINTTADGHICDSCGLNRGVQTFSSDDWMVNILGFSRRMVSDVITNPSLCSVKIVVE